MAAEPQRHEPTQQVAGEADILEAAHEMMRLAIRMEELGEDTSAQARTAVALIRQTVAAWERLRVLAQEGQPSSARNGRVAKAQARVDYLTGACLGFQQENHRDPSRSAQTIAAAALLIGKLRLHPYMRPDPKPALERARKLLAEVEQLDAQALN